MRERTKCSFFELIGIALAFSTKPVFLSYEYDDVRLRPIGNGQVTPERLIPALELYSSREVSEVRLGQNDSPLAYYTVSSTLRTLV